MTTITLPLHIKKESELYGEHFAQYQKKLRKGTPEFEKEKQKASINYIKAFVTHTQIGR